MTPETLFLGNLSRTWDWRAAREASGLTLREVHRRMEADPEFLARVERAEETARRRHPLRPCGRTPERIHYRWLATVSRGRQVR